MVRSAVGRDTRSTSVNVPPSSIDSDEDNDRSDVIINGEHSSSLPPTTFEDVGDSNVFQHVVEQQVVVRQLLQDLAERAVALRTWIQQQTPAMVEGMNMGVAVHAMALRVTQEALVSYTHARDNELEIHR